MWRRVLVHASRGCRASWRALCTGTRDNFLDLGDEIAAGFKELSTLETTWLACSDVDKSSPLYQFLEVPVSVQNAWGIAGSPLGLPSKLLCRNCYPELFNRVLRHAEKEFEAGVIFSPGIILLGNPGIGKTAFLFYALWKLLQLKQPIILKLPDYPFYFYMLWVGGVLQSAFTFSSADAYAKVGKAWFLVDKMVLEVDRGYNCKYLLTCSPLKLNFYEFSKKEGRVLLYDPVWTLQELLALNQHHYGYPADDVKGRFYKWGGIPRHVLGKVDESSQNQIFDAAGNVRDLVQIVANNSLPENQSHMISHMIVNQSSYSAYHIELASPFVRELVYEATPTAQLYEFLHRQQSSFIRNVQGTLFQRFVTDRKIPLGGRLVYRKLCEDGRFGNAVLRVVLPPASKQFDLEASAGHMAIFPEVTKEDCDAFFLPKEGNAEWDFIAHGRIYQATVSDLREVMIGESVVKAVNFLRGLHEPDKQLEFCVLVPEFLLVKFEIDWFGIERKKEQKLRKGDADQPKARMKKEEAAQKLKSILQREFEQLRQLNLVVTLGAFESTGLCPSCKGTGFVEGGGRSGCC